MIQVKSEADCRVAYKRLYELLNLLCKAGVRSLACRPMVRLVRCLNGSDSVDDPGVKACINEVAGIECCVYIGANGALVGFGDLKEGDNEKINERYVLSKEIETVVFGRQEI